jgi:hypothetical protein
MQDLKALMKETYQEVIPASESTVALLLSGGVDSLSCGFAAQELGFKVHAYTFQMGEWASADSKSAESAARMMVHEYYGMKAQNGYTQEQIERKRLSLEGVLVPVTARWNEEMLAAAGFTQIDCFWRWMNFAGWIAIKE